MVMIVNGWLVMTDAFRDELAGIVDANLFTPVVSATTYPELNSMPAVLLEALKQAPARGAINFTDEPDTNIFSVYFRVGYLGELVPAREFLQELETKYFPDFWVGGMWHFEGEPVGGAGAPWFPLPTELSVLFGGVMKDINLNAGQSPRSFV